LSQSQLDTGFYLQARDPAYKIVKFGITYFFKSTLGEGVALQYLTFQGNKGIVDKQYPKLYYYKKTVLSGYIFIEHIIAEKNGQQYKVKAFRVPVSRTDTEDVPLFDSTIIISLLNNEHALTPSHLDKGFTLQANHPAVKILEFNIFYDTYENKGTRRQELFFKGNKGSIDKEHPPMYVYGQPTIISIENIIVEKNGRIYRAKSFELPVRRYRMSPH
jgi:hypothetical protein